jgi:2-octaprenyl-6-methoxyphenol hydroxylase
MPGKFQPFDLIVCGGGMVGASLVVALLPAAEQLGLRIALIEQNALPKVANPEYQPSFDARSTALAAGSRTLLESMGVWSALAEHLTPIREIEVSAKGQFGQTRMQAEREQVPALGYVVENHWLGQVLMSHIEQSASKQVAFFSPARVNSISPAMPNSEVVIESEGKFQTLSAPLVVMADGGRSELRAAMGIDYTEQDYHQHALVANVALDRVHKGVAYERFTEQGPIALLPIESADGQARMGLVWTLSDERIDEVLALSDTAFLAQLQQAFGFRAGAITRVGERFSYPLKLRLAQEQARTGLVVLGNAAHSLHPIAGQGFNLAIRGVAQLAELIIERTKAGQPLADLEALQNFVELRRRDQQRTIRFGDTSLKLFMNRNPAVRLGRSAGLQLLDLIPPARTLLARAAMGLDTPAARLNPDE